MTTFTKTTMAATALTLLLSTTQMMAASFDCRKASSGIEHVICDDAGLSRLDAKMGRLYHKAKDLPGMKQEQRDWIKFRNRNCGSSDGCLIAETKRRIADLEAALGGSGASGGVSAPKHPKGNVYFPERGIVCDKEAGFCADREGISMGYTKVYLGQAAQDKMMRYMQKYKMDTTGYTMSNGIHCESADQKCYNNKWKEKVDRHFTNMLFR